MSDSLFSTNLPECTTDEEIIKLQEENPTLDPYYIASSVIAKRKVLFEVLYKVFEPYKDSNFLKEITTRFHQRTWEMYLGYLCIKQGKVLKESRSDDQADVQIVTKQNPIHIECIAVTHGDPANPDAVPKMHIPDNIGHIVVRDVPEDKILLRITQALNDKYKQYQKRLADNRISDKEPYVIAVNTGELGHPEQIPRIFKVVFGVGYLTLRMRVGGLPVANPTSFWSRRESIAKTNKEDINLTFFEQNAHECISAVIYSNSNVLNYLTNPREDEIILVHNPLASNPISHKEFSFLTQHYVDMTTGDVVKIEAK